MRGFVLATLVSVFTFAISDVQAARTVTITPTQGDSLQLTNPTNAAVNYDVACYSSTGTTVLNQAGISLAAGNTNVYGLDGKCASGVAPIDSSTSINGPFRCSGNVNYSAASNVCGPFYGVCTISQVSSTGASPSASGHWISPGSSSWSYQISWSSTFPVSDGVTTVAPLFASMGSGNYCYSNSSGSLWSCNAVAPSTTAAGAFCCANSISMAFCKVTVNSSSAASYLTSPQFKGGTPF